MSHLLLRHDMTLRNLYLFIFRVAGKRNDFHSIAQRIRDVVKIICRRYEHHRRQIVIQVEIMVHEFRILLGIQNLQHGARRVAPERVSKLIDFIKQEERVD